MPVRKERDKTDTSARTVRFTPAGSRILNHVDRRLERTHRAASWPIKGLEDQMMISNYLRTPTRVLGHVVSSFEDAAYLVRQHVIENFEDPGRVLVRKLREAATIDEAFLAEDCLHDWLAGPKKPFFNQPQIGF
jgi:hypothetical protein